MLGKFLLLQTLFVIVFGQASWNTARDCPVNSVKECHCESTYVDCEHKGLTLIPYFVKSNWPFNYIHLGRNKFTSLDSNSFSTLNVTEVYLNDNLIRYIDPETFNQMKGQIQLLDLRNNRLTYLPEAIGSLTNLRLLDVSENPIPSVNFNDTVMREIGDFITEFRFGDATLMNWPSSLHHFQGLQILKFFGGQMDQIPITAFTGFEWTLRKLWMQNTSLISVPIALQDLKSTTELHFDDNARVGDAGILIAAFAGLTEKLTTLSLENDGLTSFPSVLLTLGELHNLSLARNNLEFVSDQAIDVVSSNLTTINLQQCNLDRIPGALSKLPGVINLDFSYNKITTIEKNDLQHMGHLRSLNVSYNPLEYVSKSSFHNLNKLTEMVLKETIMYNVPEALKNLANVRQLDMSSSDPLVECNCGLSWLYCYMHNNNSAIHVLGNCETIDMPIEKYARERIPGVCPVTC